MEKKEVKMQLVAATLRLVDLQREQDGLQNKRMELQSRLLALDSREVSLPEEIKLAKGQVAYYLKEGKGERKQRKVGQPRSEVKEN